MNTVSRYEFTTREGYRVGIVEGPYTALEARKIAEKRYGRTDMLCSHLSDGYSNGGYSINYFNCD